MGKKAALVVVDDIWRGPSSKRCGAWAKLTPDGSAGTLRIVRSRSVMRKPAASGCMTSSLTTYGRYTQRSPEAARRLISSTRGHSGQVNGVAVSGEGRRAVSASSDHTLKVWGLEAGADVATFSCDAPAHCCALAGERMIVAGDASGRVHFLSLELPEDN